MTRSAEVSFSIIIIDEFQNCGSSIKCRNTGGIGFVIDAYSESRLMIISVLRNHLIKFQSLQIFISHRHTNQSFCLADHEVDTFGRNTFCRNYQVSLIFTIFIIHHNHHFSLFQFIQSFFNCVYHYFLLIFKICLSDVYQPWAAFLHVVLRKNLSSINRSKSTRIIKRSFVGKAKSDLRKTFFIHNHVLPEIVLKYCFSLFLHIAGNYKDTSPISHFRYLPYHLIFCIAGLCFSLFQEL